MRIVPLLPVLALLGLATTTTTAQEDVLAAADEWIDAHADELRRINQSIWSQPEVGLREVHASRELASFLEHAGFDVEWDVAGMPTAFVATAGEGAPVIGILAEYDALPGMSQAAVPTRTPREDAPAGSEGDIGHACGHSVFGTGSVGAAAAAAHVARTAGLPGTIRLYGTPAEETGIGKVYMAEAGLFDDLDAALHWHASDETSVAYATSKALISIKFRFAGLAAHASLSPHEGRSALDAVELMSVGVNYLREHLRDDARMHYVITDGGGQPNVVPPRAEVWYYLRADDHAYAEAILERVREIAEGAALMTRTSLEEQIDSDTFELLPNLPLSQVLWRQLERVGAPDFDAREEAFAKTTQEPLLDAPDEPLRTWVESLAELPYRIPASTDVGNVSWQTPTSGLDVASYTNGAPGHSWQIVACTGMSIGEKGMLVASRALAGATLELLADSDAITAARADFDARVEEGPVPTSVVPEGQAAPASIR